MSELRLQTVLNAMKENTLPRLSLDDMLDSVEVTHLEFRRYLRATGERQYSPTPGLVQEILAEDYEPKIAKTKYFLNSGDVHKIFYQNQTTRTAVEELEVIKGSKEGLTNQDLAHLYGISQARVSQIKRKHGINLNYKRLTKQQRAELKEFVNTHDVKAAVKKFGIGQATVYRILKEA